MGNLPGTFRPDANTCLSELGLKVATIVTIVATIVATIVTAKIIICVSGLSTENS